jgi:hypothetical protein
MLHALAGAKAGEHGPHLLVYNVTGWLVSLVRRPLDVHVEVSGLLCCDPYRCSPSSWMCVRSRPDSRHGPDSRSPLVMNLVQRAYCADVG